MEVPDAVESREISEKWELTHYLGGDPLRWIPMDGDEYNLFNSQEPGVGDLFRALVGAHRALARAQHALEVLGAR